ncbi:MAG: AAA family ATPase [Propionibacteriaceae bacterium]|nr:AAA family ATPase [Propionibacteriaceae bacterium]
MSTDSPHPVIPDDKASDARANEANPRPVKRFRHGLVLGKFYPPHAGHHHLIRTALRACERVTVEVLASEVESIPLQNRVEWLREDHPTARVVGDLDEAEVDYDSPTAWDAHMVPIRALLDAPVDAVFTSDAYGAELARRLGATWVQVDPGRSDNLVSGTAVRADLAGHWHELSASTRAGLAARVVVLGAESTGSTTLAEELAAHFGAAWVPEYGREHTLTRDGGLDEPWRPDEFDLIVDRQLAWEDAALRRTPVPLLVCDTDVLATALWYERYIGVPEPRILARAAAHQPDLYLLTGDEIPWIDDGARDGEHVRHAMQQRFRDVLADQPVPWAEVRGTPAERLAQAVSLVEQAVARRTSFALPLEQRSAWWAAISR